MNAGGDLDGLQQRKRSHLALCDDHPVEHAQKTTLLEEIDLLHNALPDLALTDIATDLQFLGKPLRAPLLISGMTGGTAETAAVNRDLARIAQACGIAFGLGSQRIMQRDAASAWTFRVRDVAPSALLLANIGLTQAAGQSTHALGELVAAVGADALCVHLNAAQELVQAEGDRDFRGGARTLRRLASELPVPVIVKETGCGVSRAVGIRLRHAGIRFVDVSGAGGTSWVRIESLRGDARSRSLAETLGGWGIPTAASLLMLDGVGFELIASGGVRSGLDAAKCLALGARLCGAALPVYRAYRRGGPAAATAWIERSIDELKAVMLLTGTARLADLRCVPRVLGGRLTAWLRATSAPRPNG